MVGDLDDEFHFVLHLLTAQGLRYTATKGCGNAATAKVISAQPFHRADVLTVSVFRSNPDDTVPQRGSRAFEVSGLCQSPTSTSEPLNKSVIR